MAKRVRSEVVIKINDAEVKNSLKGLGREIGRLKKEMNDLDKTDENYQRNLKRLQGELKSTRKRYGEMKDEIHGVKNETSKLPGAIKALGPAIAAAFSIQAISEFLTLAREALDTARNAKRELTQLTGMSGERLENNSAKSLALSATYDIDKTELMRTVNAAAKQLEISFEDAFDVIHKGFRDGANIGGDFLNQVREYAPFMREAKIEMEDMVNIIRLGVSEGIYNDKSIDAVKEGLLRIREATPATRAAIAGLGIDVEDLYQKIESGSLSYFHAMQMVSQKMGEIGEQSHVTGTAIADIFGGPGEDAGYRYLSSLHEITDATVLNTKELQAYNREKQLEYEANLKLEKIWASLSGSGSVLNKITLSLRLGFAELIQTYIDLYKWGWKVFERSKSLESIWNSLKTMGESVRRVLDALKNVYIQLSRELGISDEKSKGFLKTIFKFFDPIDKLEKLIGTVSVGMNVFSRAVSGTVTTFGALVATIKDLGMVIKNLDLTSPLESLKKLRDFSFSDTFSKNSKKIREATFVEPTNNMLSFANHMIGLAKNAMNEFGDSASKKIKEQQEEVQKARKAAETAWEQEMNRRSQVLNELEQINQKFYDDLLAQQRLAEDAKLELMDEGFAKEKQKLDTEFQRKIQDIQNQISEIEKYQSELSEKSKFEYDSGNVAGGDEFKRLADEQVKIIGEKNATIRSLEQLHSIKIAQIYFEYNKKRIEEDQKTYERELMNLETRHNNELKAVQSLEDAKKILRDKYEYSEDELNKLKDFEKAKSEIILAQQKKTIKKQLEQLTAQQDELKKIIDKEVGADIMGVGTMTAEQLDELILKYQELANAISKIRNPEDDEESGRTEDQQNALGQVDILGISAEEWENIFSNLDTLGGKLAAAKALATAMSQVWSQYFDAQNQKIKQDLTAFEAAANRKKAALSKQLEQGIISQETYNAKIGKLEADLEKKRAEAEYKQQMNDWKAKMLDANVSTALAIVNALASGSYPANIVFAAIVGALGAVQIGMIAKNKPKKPSGYFSGGATSGSGRYDEYGRELADGPVHAREYVIPEYLRRDPVIARMEDFIEARRLGMSPNIGRPNEGYAAGGETRPANPTPSAPVNDNNTVLLSLVHAVDRLNGHLEYLEENPIEAKLTRTLETAKKLKEDIDDYTTHRNKNRR